MEAKRESMGDRARLLEALDDLLGVRRDDAILLRSEHVHRDVGAFDPQARSGGARLPRLALGVRPSILASVATPKLYRHLAQQLERVIGDDQ
jgi:hypothetical protein